MRCADADRQKESRGRVVWSETLRREAIATRPTESSSTCSFQAAWARMLLKR